MSDNYDPITDENEISEHEKITEETTINYNEDPWAEKREEKDVAEELKAENVADEYLASLDQRADIKEPIKEKKKTSFLERASVFLVAAILFGAVAGGVFVGVNALNDYFRKDKTEAVQDDTTPLAEKSETGNNEQAAKKDVNLSEADEVVTVKDDETGETEVSAVDVSSVVDSMMPAIVAINCYQNYASFYSFGGSQNSSEQLAGSGSGIIVGQNETEVLVVTNYHVIENAERISIEFVDGSAIDATVKGTAQSSDLAVVAVSFSDMSDETIEQIRIARLGNSDDVKIGQMAIAIGNALGYGQSVTVGYISAKDREITVDNVTYTLIQTDAAINPGNSGGALLNADGEVIGINSVKYSDYAVEGMGFAIPISNITDIIEELSTREVLDESEMGYLGIKGGKDITSDYATMLGISEGLYVSTIVEDSPAEDAGMYAGDIIVSVEDTKITCMSDLQNFLAYTKAGTTVTITVERLSEGRYKEVELEVKLGNRPASN